MIELLQHLMDRIKDELDELAHLVERVQEGWIRTQRSGDDFYLDSVALNLHGFYAGMERLLELIAENIDGSLPQGANWHQLLVEQMSSEIPDVRPSVLSAETVTILDSYRGFRHVVRNVYAYKFDPLKVEKLVEDLPELSQKVQKELLAFANFLEQGIH